MLQRSLNEVEVADRRGAARLQRRRHRLQHHGRNASRPTWWPGVFGFGRRPLFEAADADRAVPTAGLAAMSVDPVRVQSLYETTLKPRLAGLEVHRKIAARLHHQGHRLGGDAVRAVAIQRRARPPSSDLSDGAVRDPHVVLFLSIIGGVVFAVCEVRAGGRHRLRELQGEVQAGRRLRGLQDCLPDRGIRAAARHRQGDLHRLRHLRGSRRLPHRRSGPRQASATRRSKPPRSNGSTPAAAARTAAPTPCSTGCSSISTSTSRCPASRS